MLRLRKESRAILPRYPGENIRATPATEGENQSQSLAHLAAGSERARGIIKRHHHPATEDAAGR